MIRNRLFKPIDNKAIGREIEEEFRFHLEMLTLDHLQQDMSLDQAKDAAMSRFGNIEQIKDQCVEISKNAHPIIRALKSVSILLFLAGVLLRVLNTEFHVTRVGDILIFIAVLSRLFVYVRGLSPSSFRSSSEASQLILNEKPCERGSPTPVERVIAGK